MDSHLMGIFMQSFVQKSLLSIYCVPDTGADVAGEIVIVNKQTNSGCNVRRYAMHIRAELRVENSRGLA